MSKQKLMKEWRRRQRKSKIHPLHLICRVGKAYECRDVILVTRITSATDFDFEWTAIDALVKGYVFTVLEHVKNYRNQYEEAGSAIWLKVLDENGKVGMITGTTSSANFRKIN